MGFEQKASGGKHPEKALSAVTVRGLTEPGMYADGGCLYLVVDESGAKRWVLRTTVRGKRRDIGLGGLSWVTLAEAREEAARLRRLAKQGADPLAQRRQERRTIPVFEAVAREVHASHAQTFRNAKCAAQWLGRLETYAFPIMGAHPVDKVEPRDVLAVLSPIWTEKPETARRVRQLMKRVFDYAKAKGWRSGDNPVEGIQRVLPKHNGKEEHFPALPYVSVPDFLTALHGASVALSIKLSFEFLILTAARTSEVILAKWTEIDMDAKTWMVPAERMKMKKEHRVPLSARCLEILEAAKEISNTEYIFAGRLSKRPLSNGALEMAIKHRIKKSSGLPFVDPKRLDTDGQPRIATPHGFRSSFRDWAEEKTTFPRSVIEAALAHLVENQVERSYLRSDLFDKRRRLMEKWAAFATAAPKTKVVQIREA